MDLADKVALVAGGASGLGRATTQSLLDVGMRVAVLDLNVDSELREKYTSGQLMFLPVDVTSATAVESAVKSVSEAFGGLYLAVNCAGIAPAKRLLDRQGGAMLLEDFSTTIAINLIGSFNVARCAAQLMAGNEPQGEAGERGVIINTASVAAYDGQKGQCAYAASKGGIVSMTLPMARDLAVSAIRVNAIAPGIMGTPMLLAMPEKVQESLTANIQFPNRMGLPEEYARLVMHIAENAYINGEVIRLDGGIRMSA